MRRDPGHADPAKPKLRTAPATRARVEPLDIDPNHYRTTHRNADPNVWIRGVETKPPLIEVQVTEDDAPEEREADDVADLLVTRASEAAGSPSEGEKPRLLAIGRRVTPSSIGDQLFDEPGRPLANPLRRYFERNLGVDLSAVRFHTGETGNRLARMFNARAFAASNHVAFANGEFRTDNLDGLHLIAHELTHTTQPLAKSIIHRKALNLQSLSGTALLWALRQLNAETLIDGGEKYVDGVERELRRLRSDLQDELLRELDRILLIEIPDAREQMAIARWADQGESYDPRFEARMADEAAAMTHAIYETTMSSEDQAAMAEELINHKQKQRRRRDPGRYKPKPAEPTEDDVSELYGASEGVSYDTVSEIITSEILPAIRRGQTPDYLATISTDDVAFYVQLEERLRTEHLDGDDGPLVATFLNETLQPLIDEAFGTSNANSSLQEVHEIAIELADRIRSMSAEAQADLDLSMYDFTTLSAVRTALLADQSLDSSLEAFIVENLDAALQIRRRDLESSNFTNLQRTTAAAVDETREYLRNRASARVAVPPAHVLDLAVNHGGLKYEEIERLERYIAEEIRAIQAGASSLNQAEVTALATVFPAISEAAVDTAEFDTLLRDYEGYFGADKFAAMLEARAGIDLLAIARRQHLQNARARRVFSSYSELRERSPLLAKTLDDAFDSYSEFRVAVLMGREAGKITNFSLTGPDEFSLLIPAIFSEGNAHSLKSWAEEAIDQINGVYAHDRKAIERFQEIDKSGRAAITLLHEIVDAPELANALEHEELSSAYEDQRSRIESAIERLKIEALAGRNKLGAESRPAPRPGGAAYQFAASNLHLKNALKDHDKAAERILRLIPHLRTAFEYDRVFASIQTWHEGSYRVYMVRGATVQALQRRGIYGLSHHAVGENQYRSIAVNIAESKATGEHREINWKKEVLPFIKGLARGGAAALIEEVTEIIELATTVFKALGDDKTRQQIVKVVKKVLHELFHDTDKLTELIADVIGQLVGTIYRSARKADPEAFGYMIGKNVLPIAVGVVMLIATAGAGTAAKMGAKAGQVAGKVKDAAASLSQKVAKHRAASKEADDVVASIVRLLVRKLMTGSSALRHLARKFGETLQAAAHQVRTLKKRLGDTITRYKPKLTVQAKLDAVYLDMADLQSEIRSAERSIVLLTHKKDQLDLDAGDLELLQAQNVRLRELEGRLDSFLESKGTTDWFERWRSKDDGVHDFDDFDRNIRPSDPTGFGAKSEHKLPSGRHAPSDRPPGAAHTGRRLTEDERRLRGELLEEMHLSGKDIEMHRDMDVQILDDVGMDRIAGEGAFALTTWDFGKPTVYYRRSAVGRDVNAEEARHVLQRHNEGTARLASHFEERMYIDGHEVPARELLELKLDETVLEIDVRSAEIRDLRKQFEFEGDSGRERIAGRISALEADRDMLFERLRKLEAIGPRQADVDIRRQIQGVTGELTFGVRAHPSMRKMFERWSEEHMREGIDPEFAKILDELDAEALRLSAAIGDQSKVHRLRHSYHLIAKHSTNTDELYENLRMYSDLAERVVAAKKKHGKKKHGKKEHVVISADDAFTALRIPDGTVPKAYFDNVNAVLHRLQETDADDAQRLLLLWKAALDSGSRRADYFEAAAVIAQAPHQHVLAYDAVLARLSHDTKRAATGPNAVKISKAYAKAMALDVKPGDRDAILTKFIGHVESGKFKEAHELVELVEELGHDVQLRDMIMPALTDEAKKRVTVELLLETLRAVPKTPKDLRRDLWICVQHGGKRYENFSKLTALRARLADDAELVKRFDVRLKAARMDPDDARDLLRAARLVDEDAKALQGIRTVLKSDDKGRLVPVSRRSFEEDALPRYRETWMDQELDVELLDADWNTHYGAGGTNVDYSKLRAAVNEVPLSEDQKAILWTWRRLLTFMEVTEPTDIMKIIDKVDGGPRMEDWHTSLRREIRHRFVERALDQDFVDGKHLAYLQRGLNAHVDSRKGATFETYRARRLGAEWTADRKDLEYGKNPESQIPGIEHGGEKRAFLVPLNASEKAQVHVDLKADKKPRSSDGTIRITDARELRGVHKPNPKSKDAVYLIDEKAGPGALTPKTVRNYLSDLVNHGGVFTANPGGEGARRYEGLIILADTDGSADRAVKLIRDEVGRLRSQNPPVQVPGLDKIHVACFNKDGRLHFFQVLPDS